MRVFTSRCLSFVRYILLSFPCEHIHKASCPIPIIQSEGKDSFGNPLSVARCQKLLAYIGIYHLNNYKNHIRRHRMALVAAQALPLVPRCF